VFRIFPDTRTGHHLLAVFIYQINVEPVVPITSVFGITHIPILYRSQVKQFMQKNAELLLNACPTYHQSFTIQESLQFCQGLKASTKEIAVLMFSNRPSHDIWVHMLLKQILQNFEQHRGEDPKEILQQALEEQNNLGNDIRFMANVLAVLRDSPIIPTIPHYPSILSFASPETLQAMRRNYNALPLVIREPAQHQTWTQQIYLYVLSCCSRICNTTNPPLT
jgi:hypothetical protein